VEFALASPLTLEEDRPGPSVLSRIYSGEVEAEPVRRLLGCGSRSRRLFYPAAVSPAMAGELIQRRGVEENGRSFGDILGEMPETETRLFVGIKRRRKSSGSEVEFATARKCNRIRSTRAEIESPRIPGNYVDFKSRGF